MTSYDQAGWKAWCQSRHDELAGPESWLGLAGLFWLAPGRNTVGSAADAAVVLPLGPSRLGEIINADGHLHWLAESTEGWSVDGRLAETESGAAEKSLQIQLQSDADGAPTVLAAGPLRFFVIAREGRLAVRVKNHAWAARRPFAGVEYFPFAGTWVRDAKWKPLDAPRTIEVPSVTGELKAVQITHRAVFEVDGKPVELLPLSSDDQAVFFVFRDRTSGKFSYGGGRFLRAEPPVNGHLRLDFNRAYNPPCAFSPFATCPLPPAENWLGFAVEAGEKRYTDH